MRFINTLLASLTVAFGHGGDASELPALPSLPGDVALGTRGHGHRSGRINRKPRVAMKAAVQLCKRQVIPAKYRAYLR